VQYLVLLTEAVVKHSLINEISPKYTPFFSLS
jgi:uncharacterized membrane protein